MPFPKKAAKGKAKAAMKGKAKAAKADVMDKPKDGGKAGRKARLAGMEM